MIKNIPVATALIFLLLTGLARAQTCSVLPNNLTNGTTADATQVMANFSYALNCVNGLRGYLGGLTISNDGTSPNTVIDTVSGVADSDDVSTMMTIPSFTKNANAAWTVGSANGCLDSGTALAASTWYSLFVIARTDTGVVDELCSASLTSPALPAGYSKKRRIGSFRTDASSHILAFSQNGDEFLWSTPTHDVGIVGTFGTTASLFALTVPSGIKVNALISITTSSGNNAYMQSPDQSGTLATGGAVTVSGGVWGVTSIRTNTSSQIQGYSQVASQSLYVVTSGWIDTRGRFN